VSTFQTDAFGANAFQQTAPAPALSDVRPAGLFLPAGRARVVGKRGWAGRAVPTSTPDDDTELWLLGLLDDSELVGRAA
jgi:hypothetical protein